MVRACTDAADALMSERGAADYVPLHDLFDEDTGSVYLDDYGHTTEEANQRVAERIAADLNRVFENRP